MCEHSITWHHLILITSQSDTHFAHEENDTQRGGESLAYSYSSGNSGLFNPLSFFFFFRSGYSPRNQPSFFCIFLLTGTIPFKGKLRVSSVIIIVHRVLEFAKHFSFHCLSHFFLITTLKNRQGRGCEFRFYKAGNWNSKRLVILVGDHTASQGPQGHGAG